MSKLQTKTIAAIAVTLLSLPLMSGAQAKEAQSNTGRAQGDLQHHPRLPSAMTLVRPPRA